MIVQKSGHHKQFLLHTVVKTLSSTRASKALPLSPFAYMSWRIPHLPDPYCSFSALFPQLCLLYNHLRDTLSTQSLAALERLSLQSSKCVEDGSEHQQHGCGNQASHPRGDAGPLYSAASGVECSAEVVGLDLSNKGVEFGRGWAKAEE